MCGICGQFSYTDFSSVESDRVQAMTRTMVHRGPDDEGFYFSGPIGLGFRRLSIIDLAEGHQPMTEPERKVWVVFNGEIYNFPALRKELEGYGHRFATHSDTEVIVHGYKQWGIEVLQHLNGMFGLGVWDEPNRRLMLARDRTGIKPVYYKVDSGQLYFGSEIRSLLAANPTKPAMDPTAINLFLRYRYTPAPLTVFQGIKKLAPGTRLIAENGTIRIERWWNFKPSPFDPMPSIKQAKADLLHLYQQALKRHLLSDVPLGLLLSGGLDSGLLLALMNQNGNSWHTFTVGFGQQYRDDELSDAAHTARVLKAPNRTIQLDRKTFEANLTKIVAMVEEPIASPSIVPMYYVSQLAREDVTVALMGQGPDELFGGYTRHLGVHYGTYWRVLPPWIRNPVKSALRFLPRNESVTRSLYSLDVPERIRRYQQVFSILPGELIDGLFQDGILPNGAGDTILDCWSDLIPLLENTDELGGLQFLEIRSSLPDELLMYGDKLSMAHGLEVRVPYLDQEIVEYVERLPAQFKVRYGLRKWLHRQVCKDFLPSAIVNRKKRGFASTVVDDWFRDSLMGEMNQTLLDPKSQIYQFLHPQAVQTLVQQHLAGQRDNHKILFSLIILEEWFRNQGVPSIDH